MGDLSDKPGWVRLSINPTMTDEEMHYIVDSVTELCKNHKKWAMDYNCDEKSNEYFHKNNPEAESDLVNKWFGDPE